MPSMRIGGPSTAPRPKAADAHGSRSSAAGTRTSTLCAGEPRQRQLDSHPAAAPVREPGQLPHAVVVAQRATAILPAFNGGIMLIVESDQPDLGIVLLAGAERQPIAGDGQFRSSFAWPRSGSAASSTRPRALPTTSILPPITIWGVCSRSSPNRPAAWASCRRVLPREADVSGQPTRSH
jgi:hypothetical protein